MTLFAWNCVPCGRGTISSRTWWKPGDLLICLKCATVRAVTDNGKGGLDPVELNDVALAVFLSERPAIHHLVSSTAGVIRQRAAARVPAELERERAPA